jgi:hypothetical protein
MTVSAGFATRVARRRRRLSLSGGSLVIDDSAPCEIKTAMGCITGFVNGRNTPMPSFARVRSNAGPAAPLARQARAM